MDDWNFGTPRKQNDRYLKDILEQNFADFLRFVFPDADGHGKDRTEMFLFFPSNIIHTRDPEVNREYMGIGHHFSTCS